MPNHKKSVWWWNLDREGNPLDPASLPPRDPLGPSPKDDSPYTPDFLVEGELLSAHLHHEGGRIVGIHGEGELAHLRLTLLLCLQYEPQIINALSGLHHFDIMLHDVYALLQLSRS